MKRTARMIEIEFYTLDRGQVLLNAVRVGMRRHAGEMGGDGWWVTTHGPFAVAFRQRHAAKMESASDSTASRFSLN